MSFFSIAIKNQKLNWNVVNIIYIANCTHPVVAFSVEDILQNIVTVLCLLVSLSRNGVWDKFDGLETLLK